MSSGIERRKLVESYRDLEVYQMAIDAAMQIFEASKCFPREEIYSLTDQIRRASRSVCANLAEAWRKRRYEGAFIAKLSDAEGEPAEVQTWLEFAIRSGYLDRTKGAELYQVYEHILGKLVRMITNPRPWIITGASKPTPDKMHVSVES